MSGLRFDGGFKVYGVGFRALKSRGQGLGIRVLGQGLKVQV